MMKVNTFKHLISASIAACALLAAAPDAEAAVPQTITQQGRLYDANGMPINSTLKVHFAIYAEKAADPMNPQPPIWEDDRTVTFEDGYFSVSLGRDPNDMDPANLDKQFAADTFNGAVRYIGITVDPDSGEKEMDPRAPVQSVPYAMNAGVAYDAIGEIHPSSIVINGTTIVDATGTWVGSPTGLVGPKGDKGDKGDQGIQGMQGPQGDPGPTGVVSTSTVALTVGTIPAGSAASPWAFAGGANGFATVTVSANQRITGSGVAVLGTSAGGNPPIAQTVDFGLCFQDSAGAGAVTPFYSAEYTSAQVSFKLPYPAAATRIMPIGGTYRVGYCVKNRANTILQNNDYVNAWFIVTN